MIKPTQQKVSDNKVTKMESTNVLNMFTEYAPVIVLKTVSA